MTPESENDLHLEIGHVSFIDPKVGKTRKLTENHLSGNLGL